MVPGGGISMSGATRPSRSYMISLISAEMMPCSARNSATRQSSRVSGVLGVQHEDRRSHFHVHPPCTWRTDVAAT